MTEANLARSLFSPPPKEGSASGTPSAKTQRKKKVASPVEPTAEASLPESAEPPIDEEPTINENPTVAVATPSLTPDQPEGAADHLAELISAQNQIEQQAQQIQILETKLQESEQGKKELEKRLQEMTKQHQILQKAQEQAQTLLKEKDQALQTLQAQHQQLQAPRQPLQVKPAAQTPKPAVIPRPVAANSQTQRGEDMPAFMLD